MRAKATIAVLFVSLALIPTVSKAQSSYVFDVGGYEAFLAAHKDMSSSELLALHPAGKFLKSVSPLSSPPSRLDSIDLKYHLTPGEKALLGTNGFVVTERLAPGSFGQGFVDIYRNDLPLFISTDAILHAVHKSYDEILKQSEEQYLIAKLTSIIDLLHNNFSKVAGKYADKPAMLPSLKDLDLYINVPRYLLESSSKCFYPTNDAAVTVFLKKIQDQYVAYCDPLFGDSLRMIDFSQFTVRGHYTQSEDLSRYFQAMIWLGRMEFYLTPPSGMANKYTKAQIQRQAVAALLFSELTDTAGTQPAMDDVDKILNYLVGEPDNVTLTHLNGLLREVGVKSADELLDTLRYNAFRDVLLTKSWAYQRILSQILAWDPFTPGEVKPASAFIPLGQRFIIDSFVSGNVVWDKIEFQGSLIWRYLPSPLDVMFALGNDPAGQLLVSELDAYHYASNLAALRYLIDSYEPEYWKTSFFNGWLHAIRALNAPAQRTPLPGYMQTASWWQEKMNTQLASWAELRHDNILYGKQSYTAGRACSYPCGYVEPIPDCYERLDTLMHSAGAFFASAPQELQYFSNYFIKAASTCSTLTSISRKEISGVAMSTDDNTFLGNTMFMGRGCGISTGGWYPGLFFEATSELDSNLVVADVHTCPEDPSGSLIGWVLHVGTGPVNLAIVTPEVPGVGPSAYIGPVMSFYQRVTTDFKRLTDEEWVTEYANAASFRPSWVNSYLANQIGDVRPLGDMLLTEISSPNGGGLIPTGIILAQNYPNPFNPSTQFYFGLPEASDVTLTIYDILGRKVAELVNGAQPAGFRTLSWNGTNTAGIPVASGTYLARFVVKNGHGGVRFSKTNRMLLVR